MLCTLWKIKHSLALASCMASYNENLYSSHALQRDPHKETLAPVNSSGSHPSTVMNDTFPWHC